ncbi:Oligopeptide ABC transporter, periplasmic oligopeptide-binding protein OppA (TC 3.A.1.5.1) [Dickeya aquatica]|uniref:Oligopeptide ABC transporter, periplasmic oligopeptide-binding protein OppA (TC 3.A.1.5.1) n=1 Tax=Dickeya aquatica TaxID=1401087 RepID=A0A375AB71_9GAMM|nr:hypothetical protein [Dickeya aquatica]SLM63313.1 Oligopeptide ABC transporter, periplasmic oligopeptide-binding protein OppA (TC 3.A.1.5.1) [Dickeya aquatica]
METDPAKRVEEFRAFQRIVAQELPDINLLQLKRLTIYNTRVHNQLTDIQGANGSLAEIWLDQ